MQQTIRRPGHFSLPPARLWPFLAARGDRRWQTHGHDAMDTTLANSWKANYHDVRAMMKFVDAFAGIDR